MRPTGVGSRVVRQACRLTFQLRGVSTLSNNPHIVSSVLSNGLSQVSNILTVRLPRPREPRQTHSVAVTDHTTHAQPGHWHLEAEPTNPRLFHREPRLLTYCARCDCGECTSRSRGAVTSCSDDIVVRCISVSTGAQANDWIFGCLRPRGSRQRRTRWMGPHFGHEKNPGFRTHCGPRRYLWECRGGRRWHIYRRYGQLPAEWDLSDCHQRWHIGNE